MMKRFNIALFSVLLLGATAQANLPIGAQNKNQSEANEQKFKNAPFFTIAVLQPTTGYKTLETHIKDQEKTIKAAGYTSLMNPDDLHLSVMVFAIPFPNGVVDKNYVQEAINFLMALLMSHEEELTGATFCFNKLESIGPKFLAAHYEHDRAKPFYRVYGTLVREFFDAYADSWMFYGYEMRAHVSVARTSLGARPVATPIKLSSAPKQPIADLTIRHQGAGYQRKLILNARWEDSQGSMVQLKSEKI